MSFPPPPPDPLRSWSQAISDLHPTSTSTGARTRVGVDLDHSVSTKSHVGVNHDQDQESGRSRSRSDVSDVSNSSSTFSISGGSCWSGASIPSLVAHDELDGRDDDGRERASARETDEGDQGSRVRRSHGQGQGQGEGDEILMTPPNATRGYFDLIRARGVDDDGPQGSRATKGKGKQLDDRPRRLFDEPGLGSSSYDDGLEDDSPGPSIRVSEPRDYLHPGLARPASALVDRNESMMSSTLFVPRGGATSSTRSGTPSTMTVIGGSMTDGRNTPIRIPSPVPGPSPLQTNELSQIPHRSSSTRELMPYPAVSTSTTTTFPDWLRSRSR